MLKTEFYAQTHNFVRNDAFKFFEESVDRNFLFKNKILREFENIWAELRKNKEYISENFISAKDQKLLIESKINSSNAGFMEKKRFEEFEAQC